MIIRIIAVATRVTGMAHHPLLTRVRAAGILVRAGRVLMESMADREVWGPPGGGVEEGESLAAACEREFREELGLAVAVRRLVLVTDHFFEDRLGRRNHEICCYFEVAAEGEPQASDHLKTGWLELAALKDFELTPRHLYELLPACVAAASALYAVDDETGDGLRLLGEG
jgi:ADP-ribose pyrophosphatase YjhB (NUDIX family)